MKNKEIRNYTVEELRVDGEGDSPKRIRGYAAVFGKLSDDLGYFREKIAPGAFSDTIKTADIRALWNHDPNFVLGRNKSGTLTLEENQKGLIIDVEPPDTQWARDLMVSIKRGDIDQMSFSFRTIADEWDYTDEKNPIRTLVKVDLFDVSPVTYPAYPQTSVSVRSIKEVYDAQLAQIKAKEQEAADNAARKNALRIIQLNEIGRK